MTTSGGDHLDGAPEVICLGETMIMVTPEPAGPLAEAETCLLLPGGAESNVAMNLAALGHRVMWCSRLGADPLGDRILSRVAGHGVDTSAVVRDPVHPTGVYFKDPAPAGTTVHYYRAGSAASVMDETHLTSVDLTTTRIVHITGITPALSAGCAAMINSLIDRLADE
ncbi:MAG: PfkB family carbohydrate kinase, partial [Propionibacteriales bacterium]|nr:PfkB family carbohydrate kinase [Propionibacteriales bacterium]